MTNVLDSELHLITPSHPDHVAARHEQPRENTLEHYQLTHDYLVPSLRSWLDDGLSNSIKGRAELRLREFVELKSSEVTVNPGFVELVTMTALVPKVKRGTQGQTIITEGWKSYRLPILGIALLFLAAGYFGYRFYENDRKRTAENALTALIDCMPNEVGRKLELAKPFKKQLSEDWYQLAAETDFRSSLRGAYAICEFDQPTLEVIAILVNAIPKAEMDQLPNIRRALEKRFDLSQPILDEAFKASSGEVKASLP